MLQVTTRSVALLVVLLVANAPCVAHAASPSSDTKECIAAFDQGQHLKSEHHLIDAQSPLIACTKETCPAVLRADCAEVLKSVQSAVPSIVLAAEDAGRDVTDVKVLNGDRSVASSLDGKAVELDPGTYDFRFERGTGTPVWVHFVLREGEKNRTVKASFNPRMPVTTIPMIIPPRKTIGYVAPAGFAALGVAGVVVAGVSRLAFNSQVDDLGSSCAPNCSQEMRADLSSTLVRANVGFGVFIGGLVLAAATWIFFTPTAQPASRTNAALTW